jgi:hypothetical protein
MANPDGGIRVPYDIAEALKLKWQIGTDMGSESETTRTDALMRQRAMTQLLGSVEDSLQRFVGAPVSESVKAEMQKEVETKIAAFKRKQELQRALQDVRWYRHMRETISKRLRNEDLSEEELQSVIHFLEGISTLNDVSANNKKQYATLLRRIRSGEDLIFIDYDVLEKLRYELNNLMVGHCSMTIRKVERSGRSIEAKVELLDPDLPAGYIQVKFTIDSPLIDRVSNQQVIPHEVMGELLERKIETIISGVEDVLKRDMRAEQTRSQYMDAERWDGGLDSYIKGTKKPLSFRSEMLNKAVVT